MCYRCVSELTETPSSILLGIDGGGGDPGRFWPVLEKKPQDRKTIGNGRHRIPEQMEGG